MEKVNKLLAKKLKTTPPEFYDVEGDKEIYLHFIDIEDEELDIFITASIYCYIRREVSRFGYDNPPEFNYKGKYSWDRVEVDHFFVDGVDLTEEDSVKFMLECLAYDLAKYYNQSF